MEEEYWIVGGLKQDYDEAGVQPIAGSVEKQCWKCGTPVYVEQANLALKVKIACLPCAAERQGKTPEELFFQFLKDCEDGTVQWAHDQLRHGDN